MLPEPFVTCTSYAFKSPKLEAIPRSGSDGYGLFASEPIQQGEVLIVWGGVIVGEEQLATFPDAYRQHSVQVEEGLYQVSLCCDEPADYMNHSCDPNAGPVGQIVIAAMRDIAQGEEVCFDYAMTDGSPYDEFECHCGAPNCRGRVTGDDWRRPELWERYKGYFSPYLQRRIDRLNAEAAAGQILLSDELWLQAVADLIPTPVPGHQELVKKDGRQPW